VKIALAQLSSTDDVATNLDSILKIVDEIMGADPLVSLIVFPENTLYFRIVAAEKVVAIDLQSEVWSALQKKAQQKKVNLHLTTAILDTDKKVYNASVLIRENGLVEVLYRKVHLFDMALSGQSPIRESDSFERGSVASVFQIGDFKFGSSICYDLRFAELYASYAAQEVDAILVPAAFLVKTGQAHWEVLLRARAIESQCFVLAPAQVGTHRSVRSEDQRETFGHTLGIGPWGEILTLKAEGVGFVIVELSQQTLKAVRTQIPMKSHRRL